MHSSVHVVGDKNKYMEHLKIETHQNMHILLKHKESQLVIFMCLKRNWEGPAELTSYESESPYLTFLNY